MRPFDFSELSRHLFSLFPFNSFGLFAFSQKSPQGKIEFKKLAVTLGQATSYKYLSNSEIKLEY